MTIPFPELDYSTFSAGTYLLDVIASPVRLSVRSCSSILMYHNTLLPANIAQ